MLNSTGYYIGAELSGVEGQDSQKLATLQFVAKLHELTILASLAAVMFTYVRRELTLGSGLPFGAVFAGFQVSNISFLWSVEFWAIIYHEWGKRRKKWFLVALISTCCLLGVSVGPSSAVLMRPRLENWPAGGTDFWVNATEDKLFPKTMQDSPELSHCIVDTGDRSCPAGAWEILARSYFALWPPLVSMAALPQQLLLPGRSSLRRLELRYRASGKILPIWTNAYSIATVPNSAISDHLAQLGAYWSYAARNAAPAKHLMLRRESEFTVDAPQPIVFVRCNSHNLADLSWGNLELKFPALGSLQLSNGANTATLSEARFDAFTFPLAADSDNTTSIHSMLSPMSSPNILWLDVPLLLNKTGTTLNAIVAFPNTTIDQAFLYACSIDSRLASHVQVRSRWTAPAISEGAPSGYDNTGTLGNDNMTKLGLSAAWAKYLNPIMVGQDRTIFSEMTKIAGMWNSSVTSHEENFEPIVEGILATLAVDGIARAGYNATMLGTLKGSKDQTDLWQGGWGIEFLPKKGMGDGGSAFVVDEEAKRAATMFTMRASVYGYAYSWNGTTQKAAVAILAVYILLALAHIVYSTYTGHSSNAWDSAPEIVALAVNSQPTKTMHNTGAGIHYSGVFKANVRVRAKGEYLKFVFDDTEDGCRVIDPNCYYG